LVQGLFYRCVTGGDIFSGGPGEFPVGKSVSACITAVTSIYMHGLTNKYTSMGSKAISRILRQPKVRASRRVWEHTPPPPENVEFLEGQISYFQHFEEFQ
jgi:hypothetical protein